MAKNDQKFSGKCQENGVVIAWSNFRIIDIIASAPSDNIFCKWKQRWGKEVAHSQAKTVKNGQKRPKMKYLAIFDHFSPFEPAQRQPIDPTSTFMDKMLSLGAVSMNSMESKLLWALTTPTFPPFA